MSLGDAKIPLPYVWFSVGLSPWIILLLLALLYEPFARHGDPFILIVIPAIVVAPICFLRGFFQSVKFTGKHRHIGLTLNGLGLGVLASLLVYGLLAN